MGGLEGGKEEQICHGYWLYLNTSERCGRAMCIYRCTYQVSATAVVIKVLVCFIPCAVDLK